MVCRMQVKSNLQILRLQVNLQRDPLPFVETLPQELGQESDDSVVRQEQVELVAELQLSLELLVLHLQLPQ